MCQGMAIFYFTYCFYCFRLVQLSEFFFELEMEVTRHLLSLWFSHIQTMQNQETSPQISFMQPTLKVLIRGHNPSSQCRPASLVIIVLHHWGSAKQEPGRPIGGRSIHSPAKPIHLLPIDMPECCVGSPHKFPLGSDATYPTLY